MRTRRALAPTLGQQLDPRLRIAQAGLVVVLVLLLVFLAAPLAAILMQAVEDSSGRFVGSANFIAYARTPALLDSLFNSLWVAALVTAIVVPLAFGFAYALRRSRMRNKALFRGITLLPLLAPSLLSAISLIYWFGNQGVLKSAMQSLGISQIYGAPGIVLAECFAVLPHTLMILVTALGAADGRLYEAADAMGTGALRRFFTVTLPGAKYGLISAALVSFTLVMTDFGIPKVIGGNFNMLATDVFKLVIGQQDCLLRSVSADSLLRSLVRLLAMLPMAVPGLVLGLGYIFFFNAPANPLNGLYHTMTLLTVCTIAHFYTTGHLTAVTALKALDAEFEAVSASLKVPFWVTLRRVTLPICSPALIDIARYFFINTMTTISAVVYLYSPETKVAAIAILNLDEAGEMGAAAAMAVLITAASAAAMLAFAALAWTVERRTQAWRT